MRLALGTGRQTQVYGRLGFVTVDAVVTKGKPDYLCEIPPLPDDILAMEFEEVEAKHFWEHLYHWQAEQLAREIVSILKPGGKLILELPNLNKAVEHFRNGEDDPRLGMWAIYGAQTDPTWIGNAYQAHKWGYTPETITEQLRGAGFQAVSVTRATERMPEVRDMRVIAHV